MFPGLFRIQHELAAAKTLIESTAVEDPHFEHLIAMELLQLWPHASLKRSTAETWTSDGKTHFQATFNHWFPRICLYESCRLGNDMR